MHISGLNFREWEWRQTWGISSIVFCVSKITKKSKGKREIVTLQKIIYEENKENLASKKSTRKKKNEKKAKWPAVRREANPGHRRRNLN